MAEKIYYSMGEVAEMLDVSPTLLRFWEKQFDIIAPRRNKKGNRLFSPGDVRNLKTIYRLVKEKGMTLAGAEKQLQARRGDIERDMEIAERLASIRALLVEVKNELGGGGIIVDEFAGEEAAVAAGRIAIEEPEAAGLPEKEEVVDAEVPEAEAVAETAKAIEAEAVTETVTEATVTEPRPESAPTYVEQTLF